MGLFKRKKKSVKFEKEGLKRGKIEKTLSYMMAVPMDPSILKNTDEMIERLKEVQGIQVHRVEERNNEEREQLLFLTYQEEEYVVGFYQGHYEHPGYYRWQHIFSVKERETFKREGEGLLTWMVFGESNINSFHLQIKILNAFVPNMVGIIDFSSEKILSGRWAKLASQSLIPPAPSYLYTIQAVVGGEDENVWLHTHGLNRCGAIDLEILGLTRDNYEALNSVILVLAEKIVTRGEFDDEEAPIYTARLTTKDVLMTTWIDYRRASEYYPEGTLGQVHLREDAHEENRGVIFCYSTETDYKKRNFVPLDRYAEVLAENPIVYYTTEETNRMSQLAKERFPYLEFLYNKGLDEEEVLLIKIGLDVDEKYRQDVDEKEHIWFQLEGIDVGRQVFYGVLTQEPYFIEGLHEGMEKELPFERLTDWIFFGKDGDEITPDSVYLLENE